MSKRGAAGGNGNASGENQEKKQANSTATQQKKAQENTAKNLPKTGELQSSASILGLAIVSGTIAAYIYNKKKKRKT
ncbi:LPXTG cell wall anchor domain-containing protein [Candidatus Enterococcus mangumiae]|uniref:LPXTG cell wall anchor domain-containing protein n=1 Tax=Candidatus Enterococcus mangumiae TaxID=2230878 RepID=UPI0030D26B68